MNTSSNVPNIPIWKNTSLEDLSGEVWMPINGYEGRYVVSNMGRVKGVRRKINKRYIKETIIKPHFWGKYLRVNLYMVGDKKKFSIHRLVVESFLLKDNERDYVNHKNAIPTDNRLSNLERCTVKENINHAFAMNLVFRGKGEKCPTSILKRNQVVEIKKRIRNGERIIDISKDYPVTPDAIVKIKSGKTWAHVATAGHKKPPN